MSKHTLALLTLALLATPPLQAQTRANRIFTHADTLRGSIGPGRIWWDVTFYDLHVRANPADSTLSGWNGITYKVLRPGQELQIDLQGDLRIDSVIQNRRSLKVRQDGNAWFVTTQTTQRAGQQMSLKVFYHGRPGVARNPPWDGGLIWAKDSLGRDWIATAVQGLGASAWWPNKDTQADEPDSQRVALTVPNPLIAVSSGRLRSITPNSDNTTTWEWFVQSPINNYGVAMNAAYFTHFSDIYHGEGGALTLDYWTLDYHRDTAQVQFQQAKSMIACFEHWFGPYPWYADGYKMVESPHLGMEHQSGVAYGNKYKNGYNGRDLSGTGFGLKWDFIIVHESGHEWFGNNLTSADVADMWVHEGFTNYSEGLYTECLDGKQAGEQYIIGSRRNIRNDSPIIAPFGVQAQGSGDMYYKSGNMLLAIRTIIDDDEKWRSILRGLNRDFRHQIVTGKQVRDYINTKSGINFDKVFDQYLTTTKVPALEYKLEGSTLSYRWSNTVSGFDMPVGITLSPGGGYSTIRPTTKWQTIETRLSDPASLKVDPRYYVTLKLETP